MKVIFISAVLCASLSMCRPLSIKGTVVDQQDEPVSGATVTLKRTGLSVLSDAGGEFLFTAIRITDTVTVSARGFQTAVAPANERGLVTMTLYPLTAPRPATGLPPHTITPQTTTP